jgi:short-subunit dehydrogenase
VKRACVVGSSDGIGLATAQALLAEGWSVLGVSRSASALQHDRYLHFQRDVTTEGYRELLREQSAQAFDALIYCAGIGEPLAFEELARELHVFEVNLMAAVATAAIALPAMLAAKRGHLIVLSSLADVLVSSEYPSYSASKAAVSSYFSGLGEALRTSGVVVSHIRFGFVDTKMAKARLRPFMVSREVAAKVVLRTVAERRRRVSYPQRMALLATVLQFLQAVKRAFASWSAGEGS